MKISALKWIAATCALMAGLSAHGAEHTIRLHPSQGDPIVAGTVSIDGGGGFQVIWDDDKFGDYFLSMRPFKCLEGADKLWCRVAYPYENRRSLAGGDATDLEYDLLFVWKNAADYGIDMWNGVYYRLMAEEGGWTGVMHEMDMDMLAAPPEDGTLRPITHGDLEPGDPDSHWLPKLTIMPEAS